LTPYYQEDGVTIYHGDCLDILHSCEITADVMVTDPPYGVGLEYGIHDDSPALVRDVVVPAICDALSHVHRGIVTPGSRCAFMYPAPMDLGAIYFPAGAGFARWGFCCSQPILYYGLDPKPTTRKEPNSVTCTEASEKNGHPCPKPYQLMKWLVARASLPKDCVLDPFMGSGTTLLAAKHMGHTAIGIEIEERYCEIAAERLRQRVLDF